MEKEIGDIWTEDLDSYEQEYAGLCECKIKTVEKRVWIKDKSGVCLSTASFCKECFSLLKSDWFDRYRQENIE